MRHQGRHDGLQRGPGRTGVRAGGQGQERGAEGEDAGQPRRPARPERDRQRPFPGCGVRLAVGQPGQAGSLATTGRGRSRRPTPTAPAPSRGPPASVQPNSSTSGPWVSPHVHLARLRQQSFKRRDRIAERQHRQPGCDRGEPAGAGAEATRATTPAIAAAAALAGRPGGRVDAQGCRRSGHWAPPVNGAENDGSAGRSAPVDDLVRQHRRRKLQQEQDGIKPARIGVPRRSRRPSARRAYRRPGHRVELQPQRPSATLPPCPPPDAPGRAGRRRAPSPLRAHPFEPIAGAGPPLLCPHGS